MKKSAPTKMTPAKITAFLDALKTTENAQKFASEQLTEKIQQWQQDIKTIQDQLTTKSSELPTLKKGIESKLKEIDNAITAYGKPLNTLRTDTIPEFDKKLDIILTTDSKNTNITAIQTCITNIKTHVSNQHALLTAFIPSFALVKECYETPLHVEKLSYSAESLAVSLAFLEKLKNPQASLTSEHQATMCLLSGKLKNAQQSLAALSTQNANPVKPTTPASSDHKGALNVTNK